MLLQVTLFYDIAITIGDEVEHIWLKPKYTRMTILWALVSHSDLYFSSPLLISSQNRYITPLGFIVIIVCELLDNRVRMLTNFQ
jgi:hypothetical protein